MDPALANICVNLSVSKLLHQNEKGEIVDHANNVVCPAEIKPKVVSLSAAAVIPNLKFYSRTILVGTQVRIYWYKYPNTSFGLIHLSTNHEVYPNISKEITDQVRFAWLEPDLVYYATLLPDNKLVLSFITDRKGKAIKNITHIVKSGFDAFSHIRIFTELNWILDKLIGDMLDCQTGIVLYGESAQEIYDVPNPKYLMLLKQHLQKLA